VVKYYLKNDTNYTKTCDILSVLKTFKKIERYEKPTNIKKELKHFIKKFQNIY